MSEKFQAVVIGGGPGGYVCAIRSAQLGLKTACVESRGALGGTCLNVGCIPSKSLLNLSENYHSVLKHYNGLGIEVENVKLNLKKMMMRKEKSVSILTKGVEFLFKKNKVTYLKGKGSIVSANKVSVENDGKKIDYNSKNIVISTGSVPSSLSKINIDEKIVVSSTGALSFSKVPKNLIIIGGGYIGLEMGSIWKRLGANITVIEYLDHIVPGMDQDISKEFLKILTKQGINFKLNSKVIRINVQRDSAIVEYINNQTSKKEIMEADKVLVAVGRKPNTKDLNLDKLGVICDKNDKVKVDKNFRTSKKNIYAIGDVIEGPMLAHKAEEEGIAVAEIICGQAGHVNYEVIPGVIYTSPEVATVGKTEGELSKKGVKYKIGKFPFLANSRAKVNENAEGFVKILVEDKTDKVLGVHMIGPNVGDLIGEIAIAMEFGASSEDIARTCHAHPTYSEAIKEAALAVDKRAIHF